ncbi:MAG: hypothetical protein Q8869_01910, partial [Candidatus Phytoplasma australasiaticum]|nr:hypothetical protein [Candidatus Phytoplasma australasiaticum]
PRFFKLAILVDSVICCRASPKQKAYLVKSVRKHVLNGEEVYKVYSKKIFVPDQDLKLYLQNLKQELDKNNK